MVNMKRSRLRLGIVPYLNVLPLLEGLSETFPEENWVRATPRDLATHLREGTVDVAIVSVYEGIRAGYAFVPGAALGSEGPVRSVSLFSKVRVPSIRRVLLDRASLTSIHLAMMLLRDLHGIEPETEFAPAPIRPDFDWRGHPAEAFVVIGDTALEWEHAFPHRMDLGEAWNQLTGLPFVFAAWYIRNSVELEDWEAEAFARARARGEQSVETILTRLPPDVLASHGGIDSLRHYFTRAMRYALGERERAGLALFTHKLRDSGLELEQQATDYRR